MTPSAPATRLRAGLAHAFLALALLVAAGCVTVASEPELAVAPDAAAAALPAATVVPSAAPALAATAVPATGTLTPSVLATLEPPAPTASPVRSSAPAMIVVPSAAPALAATAVPAMGTAAPSVLATLEPPAAESSSSVQVAAGERVDGPRLDKRTVGKLERILRNRVTNKGIAGLQAAVRLPSGETWLGTAGQRQFGPDRPVEDDTVFAIASVTKTFVAALILQLAEEGKVDLDAPFGTYFTDAPRKETVTLRQLLSHTSGIYDFFGHPRYIEITTAWWQQPRAGGLKARDHEWTYEEVMDLVKGGYCKPGKCYRYSNTNYLILGKVAEAVEGKPLHKQLRQRFFAPLGLQDTYYQPAEKPPADSAHGHWNWGGGYTDHTGDLPYVPFMAAASVAGAAGAIASTARDLSVWADALYGGKVLSEESLAQMTTFLRPGFYGLGTDVAEFVGNRGHGHRGGLRGFESSMWYFPESGVSVVLLSNQGNWLTDEPMAKLVKAVLGSR